MKKLNREVGKNGEEIAAEYLRKKGYSILDKNSATKFGEIDLIAAKDGKLVFVEVKLKQTENFGTPEDMINTAKISQVKRTAELYLMANKEISAKFDTYQIDAVCIVKNQNNEAERVTHYENISF